MPTAELLPAARQAGLTPDGRMVVESADRICMTMHTLSTLIEHNPWLSGIDVVVRLFVAWAAEFDNECESAQEDRQEANMFFFLARPSKCD